ncbi:MAG: 5-carboxymethyl-2-hydroxymuconate Delta-isomerase [Gammaproteobacteria bacterium]|nr:5-carboxymethyl-2-hydroxymuconate Delta-isomerase [Gammaproteobacteria bacterium]MCP4980894.1 5-carboxymethyl-2-hydroxymuconate Delta-isomerase [Gammaproteobacteria bacterium]
MPHIVLEYSANLPELPDFRALFDDIHQVMNRTGGIKIANCKSRVRVAEHCYIGDGDPDNTFIHLQIEFVKGRSREVKQAIGQECLDLVKRYYHLHLSDALQITVKIEDIALDFYFKDPAGTLSYQ